MTTGYLEHFGIRGMHWGHRKSKIWSSQNKPRASGKGTKQEKKKMSTKKKVAIGAAIVGGTLLAAYGGYKVSEMIKKNKLKPFTTDELRKMGIATFDVDTFTPDTFEPDGKEYFSEYAKSGSSALKKASAVDDYTQELLRRGRA